VLILSSVFILFVIFSFLLGLNDHPEMAHAEWKFTLGSLLFTLVTILTGGWYIYLGVIENSASKLNYGLILIVALVMFKFFVDEFSLVTRGVAFIVLGATLIGVNVWHNRRGVA